MSTCQSRNERRNHVVSRWIFYAVSSQLSTPVRDKQTDDRGQNP